MTKSVFLAGAATLASAASLAHAYVCLGDAETRFQAARAETTRERNAYAQERQAQREREHELLTTLEGEKEKSPVRRASHAALQHELDTLQDMYAAVSADLERVTDKGKSEKKLWMSEKTALGKRIEDMMETLAHETQHQEELREQNETMLAAQNEAMHAAAAEHRQEQDALRVDTENFNTELKAQQELRATEKNQYAREIADKTASLESVNACTAVIEIAMSKVQADLSTEQELRAVECERHANEHADLMLKLSEEQQLRTEEAQRHSDEVAAKTASEEKNRESLSQAIVFVDALFFVDVHFVCRSFIRGCFFLSRPPRKFVLSKQKFCVTEISHASFSASP